MRAASLIQAINDFKTMRESHKGQSASARGGVADDAAATNNNTATNSDRGDHGQEFARPQHRGDPGGARGARGARGVREVREVQRGGRGQHNDMRSTTASSAHGSSNSTSSPPLRDAVVENKPAAAAVAKPSSIASAADPSTSHEWMEWSLGIGDDDGVGPDEGGSKPRS